jgi:predicted metal-dependent hydrolase
MAQKKVYIEDIGAVTLTKYRRSRHIRIKVSSRGVAVSLPFWTPYGMGVDYVISKKQWILDNQIESPDTHIPNNAKIGKAHRVLFAASTEAKTSTVRIKDQTIIVKYPAQQSHDDASVQLAAQKGAKKALQKQATSLLPQRLLTLSEQHNFTYNKVSVKQLKARWGSCDSHKNITLNYYLMQLPWRLIDYVLLHELTHTEYMNHGTDFWARLDRALPGSKLLKKELKSCQTTVIPLSDARNGLPYNESVS